MAIWATTFKHYPWNLIANIPSLDILRPKPNLQWHCKLPHVTLDTLTLTWTQMWTLFTKALSRSPSTTQVAILNTSANFMLTAILGLVIFSESLPPLWFVGAALLVAGNVIIGRREEKEIPVAGEDAHRTSEEGGGTYSDAGEGQALLADDIELETDVEDGMPVKRRDDEDILDLQMPPDELRRVG